MKRGEISSTQLIIGILAVVVAGVMLIIAFKIGGITNNIDNSLVNYNNSKAFASGGALRYHLEKGVIETYNGKTWVREEGDFFLGNYKFNSESLKGSLRDYYYLTPRNSYLIEGEYVFDCESYVAELGMHECYTVFYNDQIPKENFASNSITPDSLSAGGKYNYPFLRAFVKSPVSDVLSKSSNKVDNAAVLVTLGKKAEDNYGSLIVLNDNSVLFTPKGSSESIVVSEQRYPGSLYLVDKIVSMRDSIFEEGADRTRLRISVQDRRTGQTTELNLQPKKLQNSVVIFPGETL